MQMARRGVCGPFAYCVEMGGIEPPSKAFSARYTTSLVGVLFHRSEPAPTPFRVACQIIFRGRILRSEPRQPDIVALGSGPVGLWSSRTLAT
jgi:hypothetical protein